MTTLEATDMIVEQLQSEIKTLSESDFARLRNWLIDLDWERWDRQLESDLAAGKLDFLIDEAVAAESTTI